MAANNELICWSEKTEVRKVRVKPKRAIVCTKNGRSYEFTFIADSSHVNEVSVQEIDRQAALIVDFLQKMLPKKIYKAVHIKIANGITKKTWQNKKKQRERREAREKQKEVEVEVTSWRDEVPESF